jgi:hypothetical protein
VTDQRDGGQQLVENLRCHEPPLEPKSQFDNLGFFGSSSGAIGNSYAMPGVISFGPANHDPAPGDRHVKGKRGRRAIEQRLVSVM